jgi:hypothetical protein
MQRLSGVWNSLKAVTFRRPASSIAVRPQTTLSRIFGARDAHMAAVKAASSTYSKGTPNTPEKYGNFDLIQRVKLDFTDVVVSKWRSHVTGLSIVHLDYDGQ